MLKKIILVSICLILLVSCGRKNEPKFEATLGNNDMAYKSIDNFYKMQKKYEIYQ